MFRVGESCNFFWWPFIWTESRDH